MQITDLLGEDDMLSIKVASVGKCPSCSKRKTLYRILYGKEILFICFDCFGLVLRIASLKGGTCVKNADTETK